MLLKSKHGLWENYFLCAQISTVPHVNPVKCPWTSGPRWARHDLQGEHCMWNSVSVAFGGEYLLWWECNSEEMWRQCAADAWAVIPVPGRDMKTIMTTTRNHFHINMIYGNSRHKHFWCLINLRKHRYVFDVLSFPMIGKMTGWNVASLKTNIRSSRIFGITAAVVNHQGPYDLNYPSIPIVQPFRRSNFGKRK